MDCTTAKRYGGDRIRNPVARVNSHNQLSYHLTPAITSLNDCRSCCIPRVPFQRKGFWVRSQPESNQITKHWQKWQWSLCNYLSSGINKINDVMPLLKSIYFRSRYDLRNCQDFEWLFQALSNLHFVMVDITYNWLFRYQLELYEWHLFAFCVEWQGSPMGQCYEAFSHPDITWGWGHSSDGYGMGFLTLGTEVWILSLP